MSFAFIVNLYKEPPELVKSFEEKLVSVYPEAKIIYLADGPDAIEYGENYFRFPERLKVPTSPGKWVHRYLNAFLEHTDADYGIKIDPDASAVNRMTTPPSGDVFCAKLYYPSTLGYYLPHAGIIGFSRSYSKRMIDEKLFLRDIYKIGHVYLNREERVFKHLFRETNANVVDRPDFCCGPVRNREYTNEFVSFKHK